MNYDFNYALTVFVDTVMKRYADFEGRTSRRDFWHYVSIALLIAVGFNILSMIPNLGPIFGLVSPPGQPCPSWFPGIANRHSGGKAR